MQLKFDCCTFQFQTLTSQWTLLWIHQEVSELQQLQVSMGNIFSSSENVQELPDHLRCSAESWANLFIKAFCCRLTWAVMFMQIHTQTNWNNEIMIMSSDTVCCFLSLFISSMKTKKTSTNTLQFLLTVCILKHMISLGWRRKYQWNYESSFKHKQKYSKWVHQFKRLQTSCSSENQVSRNVFEMQMLGLRIQTSSPTTSLFYRSIETLKQHKQSNRKCGLTEFKDLCETDLCLRWCVQCMLGYTLNSESWWEKNVSTFQLFVLCSCRRSASHDTNTYIIRDTEHQYGTSFIINNHKRS